MKLLSGILGLTLTSVVALASANAADIYRPGPGGYKDGPVCCETNWSGFYVGVNGGYGWSERTDFLSPTGGFGGGQLGYNWQNGRFVFGFETDFQGADISDSNAFGKSTMNWFGTVRGRLGYAIDRTLVYGTGGFAYGNVENTFIAPLGGPAGKFSETQTGFVVGGGAEYKINPAWSLKAEYQYMELDSSFLVGPLGGGLGNKTEVSTVRAGLNYHVGTGYEPLK